jgi:hypothetical protein
MLRLRSSPSNVNISIESRHPRRGRVRAKVSFWQRSATSCADQPQMCDEWRRQSWNGCKSRGRPRRGRPSSPVLRFLGGELRIVRFRVRAVNSSKAWNKSLRAGFNLAGHISRVNVKQWHFSRSQFWGTAKRRLRDVRMRKLLHPQAPQNVGVRVIHITTGIRCIEL